MKPGTNSKEALSEFYGAISNGDTPSKSRTLGPYDPLQWYFRTIQKYDLLTREEEKALAIRIRKQGDMEAVQRMITSNLRLVVKIALSFQRYWTKNLLDLIQEGNLGLLKAVKKFDPYRGIKFSYYASYWIKAYILKFIMDNFKLIKIGTTQNQRKLFFGLTKEKDKLLAQGLDPAPKLLAERLDVKESDIVQMSQRLGHSELSFDAPIGEDTHVSLGDRIPGNDQRMEKYLSDKQFLRILTDKLKGFRGTLSGKEADIFDNRIMANDPLTLQELGNKHHISRERVRQIQAKTIQDIKKRLEEEIPHFEDHYNELVQ